MKTVTLDGSAQTYVTNSKLAARHTGTRVKSYILDTCVLIHDPRAIFNFEKDNTVAIPVEVLEELDHIKTETDSERGRNARQVARFLAELFPDKRTMAEGARLPHGGNISISIRPGNFELPPGAHSVLRDSYKMDNSIIETALYIKSTSKPPVILVTKDVNMQLKARAVGLDAEDYLNDTVGDNDVKTEHTEMTVERHALQSFASNKAIDLEYNEDRKLGCNEYVLLSPDEGGSGMPGRAVSDSRVVALSYPDAVRFDGSQSIRPRNLEQQFLLDAIFNPEITLIAVKGKAGTGKTLLAVAGALAQVMGPNPRYDQLLITRAIMALGKDLGFLPGTMEEKMKPWLAPYYDALQYLMPLRRPVEPQFAGKPVGKKNRGKGQRGFEGPSFEAPRGEGYGNGGKPPMKPHERLLASGVVTIEPLTYIRGRSIPNAIFIVDESQQLTPQEVKTIATRMAEGSKLIFMGDPAQIDNPYVDRYSNGLVYLIKRMRNEPFFASISLVKGERSEMSERAAELL